MEAEKHMQEGLEIRDIKLKPEQMSFIEHLSDSLMQKISPTGAAGLDGLVSIWHPALQIQ
jgi:diketogulonate reductase-like aldo/keto reductase